jgi:hypothetical protein
MGTTGLKCCQVFLARPGSSVSSKILVLQKSILCTTKLKKLCTISLSYIYICLDLNLLQVYNDGDLGEWVSISCIIKKQVYDAEWVFC